MEWKLCTFWTSILHLRFICFTLASVWLYSAMFNLGLHFAIQSKAVTCLWCRFTAVFRGQIRSVFDGTWSEVGRTVARWFVSLTPDVRRCRCRPGPALSTRADTKRRRRCRSHAVARGVSRTPEPRGSHNSAGPWPHPRPGAGDPSRRCHGNWLIMRRPSEIGSNQLTAAGAGRPAGLRRPATLAGDDCGVKPPGLPAADNRRAGIAHDTATCRIIQTCA